MYRVIPVALAVAFMAAGSPMQPSADLDVRLSKPSAAALYRVSMHPMVDQPGINQIHDWEIEITTDTGKPVPNAHIGFSGGMPEHHHGFPTNPHVTESLGNGRYVLGGVKFSMTGWWQMKLDIKAPQGRDTVTFNTVILDPAPAPLQAGRQ
jgi:hypothetical protein